MSLNRNPGEGSCCGQPIKGLRRLVEARPSPEGQTSSTADREGRGKAGKKGLVARFKPGRRPSG